MATKLSIYNKALRHLGETRLTATTDTVPSRYEIDDAWADVLLQVLRDAPWNFATVTATLSSTTGTIAGYTYVFTHPSDCVRIIQVAGDTAFASEIDHRVEGLKIHTKQTPAYIRYVSNALDDDDDIATWPIEFVEAVALRIAAEICERMTQNRQRAQDLLEAYGRALDSSMTIDGQTQLLARLDQGDTARRAIWASAFRHMGKVDPRLLADTVRARYQMASAWDTAVNDAFKEGYWNFATKTTTLVASTEDTIVGYSYVWDKPTDWLRTIQVASDSNFDERVDYRDESGVIHTRRSPVYLRYTSDELAGQSGVASWPSDFAEVVAIRLAYLCAPVLGSSKADRARLEVEWKDAAARSKNFDAMDQGPMVIRRGNWVRAMQSSRGRMGQGTSTLVPTDVSIDTVGSV